MMDIHHDILFKIMVEIDIDGDACGIACNYDYIPGMTTARVTLLAVGRYRQLLARH